MQKWVLYACAILTLTSIFHMLTPDGAIKGTMRFVLNLFLIGLILTPIFKNVSSTNINSYFNSNQSNTADEKQVRKLQNTVKKQNLENALTLLLQNNGFKNFKIILKISNLQNKNKKPKTQINILFNKNEQPDKTKLTNLIKKETGTTPNIIVNE